MAFNTPPDNSMISIIIPVFNESKSIAKLLDHLRKNTFGHKLEIIIVDGGSSDDLRDILNYFPEVRYTVAKKGRAKQMNHGAKMAHGNMLYFLHADSFPPKHFDHFIYRTLTFGNGVGAGCFMLRFDSSHWWLRLMGWATAINHTCCRGGDQSLFVDQELFSMLGGFNECYEIYEDNEFIQRLYKQTKFKVIPKTLTTSSRHYKEIGVWRLQWLHMRVYLMRWLGAGPNKINAFHKKRIELLKERSRH